MNEAKTQSRYDVFLSYKRADQADALRLRDGLAASGISCWMDQDIPPGSSWADAITEALCRCRLLLVLHSAHLAPDSRQVEREVIIADNLRLPLLFARLDPTELQGGLALLGAASQWLNLHLQAPADQGRLLLESVQRVLLRQAPVPPAVGRPPGTAKVVVPFPPPATARAGMPLKVALLYKRHAEPDESLLRLIETTLTGRGHEVFHDRHLPMGVEWFQALEDKIRRADVIIPLLSARSVESEMLGVELHTACEARQKSGEDRPRLLPVRVAYEAPLPEELAGSLDRLQYFPWGGPADNDALLRTLVASLERPPQPAPDLESARREPPTGAMPPTSVFYLERPTDARFRRAMDDGDSVILVKGGRQMGKTSLIARGLHRAREAGDRVALTDLQRLNLSQLDSLEHFYQAIAGSLARQLGLKVPMREFWQEHVPPNENFDNFIYEQVLTPLPGRLVWAMDEVDRLFGREYSTEVFGLLRTWHNTRAFDPTNTWRKLTLVIGCATEASLFIDDLNMSPFNVGTQLTLDDFTPAQVAELNDRYGRPLAGPAELARLVALVGGQPYLVRRSLHEMAVRGLTLGELEATADRDEGLFGDHLRRFFVLLGRDDAMLAAVRAVLGGQKTLPEKVFYRLRSAGLLSGDYHQDFSMRCGIYARYLRRLLL